MSRIANSVRNARTSLFFSIATLLVMFFSRQVFIVHVGDTLVGLTSTMMNILGFLNLAELGLTSAIAGVLYRYIYLDDREKIRDTISIFGYLYRIIGLSILGAGLILSLFLPLIFKNSDVSTVDLYFCFFTYLSTSLVGYFISYRQTLLSADQKEYVVTTYTNVALILKQLLQIVLLKYFGGSYGAWLAVELCFGLLYGFVINRRVGKTYPWLKTSYARGKQTVRNEEYKGLFRTIRQVIPHNLGAFVLFQTDSILIFVFASLKSVTLYTNYLLIFTRITYLIKSAMRGTQASVGNLVAEGNDTQIQKVFREYNALFYFLAGTVCLCLLNLTEPFVTLWLGGDYLLGKVAFYLFLVNTYIGISRLSVDFFIGGYVLYKDVWAPVTEAAINLGLSLIFGYFWGIAGVLLGSTVSLLCIVVIWKPYFLHREGFRQPVRTYWIVVFKYVLLLVVTGVAIRMVVASGVLPTYDGFVNWVVNGLVLFTLSVIVYGSLLCLTDRGSRDVYRRLWGLLRRSP